MYWVVWCGGAVLARRYSNGKLKMPSTWFMGSALLAITIAVAAQMRGVPSPYLELLFGYFYFTLLWYGISSEHLWISRVPNLMVKTFTVLGTCSFSLYLIHKPIFKLCGVLWVDHFGSKPVNFLIPLAFSFLIVIVAWVFYLVIEAPTHKWAKKISRARQNAAALNFNN
jgi:peptidoglycan/LPS O-acetylase OafA/YrhL